MDVEVLDTIDQGLLWWGLEDKCCKKLFFLFCHDTFHDVF